MRSFRAASVLLSSLALLVAPAAVRADATPPLSASVIMSDTGFSPATVTVAPGGTVTWTNQGANVHTATASWSQIGGNPPQPFDTGGLGTGQSASQIFTRPGTYVYGSQPDCLGGNISATFNCSSPYTVVVSQTPAASASASPVPGTVPQSATVVISDSGISPSSVSITLGGTVTWVNAGTVVHAVASGTATGDPTAFHNVPPPPFNSGGIDPGQSFSEQFPLVGSYTYSVPTDCGDGNANPAFNCSGPFTLSVLQTAVGASGQAAVPPFSGSTILIKDDSGITPPALTIQAGQSVTWLNLSMSAHAVVSDPGTTPSFDSGGVGTGSTFTVTFPAPGTYGYHDPTTATWSSGSPPTVNGYRLTGKVTVQ